MALENIKSIAVTPTIDTNIYASGDRFGSLMTLPDVVNHPGESVFIDSVMMFSKSVPTAPAIYFLFFNDIPTIASADNAAIDIADAEMLKCQTLITLNAASFKNGGGVNQVGEQKNQGASVDCLPGSRTIYCQAVIEGTPTYSTTTDVKFIFKLRSLF